MSRPTKFEDLNVSYQRGPRVAIFEPSYFLSLPRKALIRTLKTLEALDKSVADGLLNKEGSIDNSNNETVIYYLRPTDEDRERKLRGAQSEWDRTKKYYENPASAPDWMHYTINQWADQEGKPTIDWSDTENN